MELVFNTDDKGIAIRVVGDVVSYDLTCSVKITDQICLSIKIVEYSVVKNSDPTKILPLPDAKNGCLRIYGANEYRIVDGIMHISFHIKSTHVSYEEACAKEMEDIMRKEDTTGLKDKPAKIANYSARHQTSNNTLPIGFGDGGVLGPISDNSGGVYNGNES